MAHEVRQIESEYVRDFMNAHRRCESRVVNLHLDNSIFNNQPAPLGVYFGAVRQKTER